MIIDCISDLHGFQPQLEGGDLLIVSGDFTARDTNQEHQDVLDWLDIQDYEKVVVIAGNHDGFLEKNPEFYKQSAITYLCDSGCEFKGYKIWGSPWTPIFCDWHFMLPIAKRKEKWALIPNDIDILITHGPPYRVLDKVPSYEKDNEFEHVGCYELKKRVDSPLMKNLSLHVFGHIHEGYGQMEIGKTRYVNCAIMDERYKPVNKPIRIEL
jgi:Icc-related predicted phosphoesterase